MLKKLTATVSLLLIISLFANYYLYIGYKKVKTSQQTISSPVEVKLEEVTKLNQKI